MEVKRVKGKTAPVPQHHVMKACRRHGCKAPVILLLC